jgi:tRNA threonylcarbamoyladenosine biosynthesis protein TsaB
MRVITSDMLLLAVDTSGRQGGITLARGGSDRFEVIESASIQGGTFSAELIPQIAQVLGNHALALQHLQGLVAVSGPGSFTGLRVGLTAVKGLSEALHLPIATVTSLEVLMAASTRGADGMAVIDAGRGEVYVRLMRAGSSEEVLLPIAEATAVAKAHNLRVLTADPQLASKFDNAETIEHCSSEVAARLGLKKLLEGDTVDVLALDANYIRKSDAEYMQKLRSPRS